METVLKIILDMQLFSAGYFYGRSKPEMRNSWHNLLFVFAFAAFGTVIYLIAAAIMIYKHVFNKK